MIISKILTVDLTQTADAFLYKAKENVHNRIEFEGKK